MGPSRIRREVTGWGWRVAALCALALSPGCGYKAGFLIPADVHTVHVEMTDNRSQWREAWKVDNLSPTPAPAPGPRPAYTMEAELTERIKNEVVRRTPLRLADAKKADTVLATTITGVKVAVLVRDGQDNVTSERVEVRVDFTWRDRRTGRILAEGKGMARPADFETPQGETFATAARRSFDRLAESIVEQMQEPF
jgi:hypothetical protein